MKKKLESELMSIAHRILKLKGKEDIDRLHEEVAELYQKLTVLKFAYDNFSEPLPSLGDNTAFHSMVDRVFEKKVGDNIEIDDKIYVNMDEVEEDDIMEPAIETIKDIVAQIPPESRKVDELIKAITDVSNGGALEELLDHYSETPEFEPADSIEKEDSTEKKSLNDKLRQNPVKIIAATVEKMFSKCNLIIEPDSNGIRTQLVVQ